MENFIYDYFIDPIWRHSGYNIVNTLTYAVIAIIAVYLIYRVLKNRIKIDKNFVCAILWFVLFGSTLRVVTDSIDSGVMQPVTFIHQFVLDSHIYDYGYLTVSPGVYIVTASLLFISMFILYSVKRLDLLGYVGIALWIPHLFLILPFMQYWIYIFPILILAGIPAYFAFRHFKNWIFTGIVGGHALDGAATFFAIDIFPMLTGIQYSEQHVIGRGLAEIAGGYYSFYLVKILIAVLAAHFIMKEKIDIDEKNYIALVLMIIGFAPGIRDILRMMIGG